MIRALGAAVLLLGGMLAVLYGVGQGSVPWAVGGGVAWVAGALVLKSAL